MEEEKRLPKNIRQMAEKEERVRVYLEDYAYTFIHKLNCTERVRTGVLLGTRMIAENKRCWFVKGAVELEDGSEQSNEPEKEADSGLQTESGNETQGKQRDAQKNECFTEQIWEATQSVIQEYFPGCSVCGWFICASEENFPDKEQLKKTHRQIFSGENCLMYWREGDEDCFWMEEDDTVIHLKGYFVYYEKNPEMQNYMLSRHEEQSEAVSDQAAFNFRKIMKEKHETQNARKKQEHAGTWMKTGAAAAVILLLGGGVFLSRGMEKKKEDSIQALAVGASVERQSLDSSESFSVEPSESETVQSEGDRQTQAQAADAQSEAPETQSKAPDTQSQAADAQSKTAESETQSEEKSAPQIQKTDKNDTAAVQGEGIFSGDMLFYRDGLGASVYRITGTGKGKEDNTDTNSEEVKGTSEDSTEEILKVELPTFAADAGTQEDGSQNSSDALAQEAAVNHPASYTVQPGDTLIEISKRFYGSSAMVMQIKEANGLEDINKIYIGQELALP